ncbi:GDP-mannose 4,6-dehydratase [Rhabdothermincola sp.]|jgi:GDP-4-dehydro-6-deoxy-D-mannose reductase|uniref:GDP-mannose 4,6-dehydratase n=1 Tax=Rhabdothermincola sp. TaxID=2820405 RepID=UPI002FE08741
MKALVTGAAGFVGRHLTAHLAAMGDEVVGIDRHAGHPDLLDAEGLAALVRDEAPDAVYHLGGWSDVGASWEQPIDTFRVNAEGTLNLLLACRGLGARVLVVTSADVYGKVSLAELPLTEESPLRPITPYAASKIAADYLGLQAWLGYRIAVVRARAFNHLGPGQSNRFVCPALAERIARNELEGREVVPVGNLTPRRDFTDVRDVVRAYRLLVLDGEPGEAYNVCRGVDIAISELADRLVGMASRPMRLEGDPDLQRPVDVPILRGDYTKLHKDTGWEPQIPLDETLADVLDEWRARVGA